MIAELLPVPAAQRQARYTSLVKQVELSIRGLKRRQRQGNTPDLGFAVFIGLPNAVGQVCLANVRPRLSFAERSDGEVVGLSGPGWNCPLKALPLDRGEIGDKAVRNLSVAMFKRIL